MLMIKIILLFSILLSTLFANSQEDGYTILKDTALFKSKMTEFSEKINTLQASYTQEKHLSFIDDIIISNGEFKFKKENKIRWEYTKPYKYLVIINGSKITIKDENKTNTIDSKNNKVFEQINKIVSYCINGSILNSNNDFELKYFENKSNYLIKMTPKSVEVKKYLKVIDLYIDKLDFSVSKIKMNESSEDFTIISFSNKKLNNEISEEAFIIK